MSDPRVLDACFPTKNLRMYEGKDYVVTWRRVFTDYGKRWLLLYLLVVLAIQLMLIEAGAPQWPSWIVFTVVGFIHYRVTWTRWVPIASRKEQNGDKPKEQA